VKTPPEEQPDQKPTPEQEAQFRKMLEHTSCSFREVEILPRNIGYLKFNAFPDPTFCVQR
jgi:hypothetical protein